MAPTTENTCPICVKMVLEAEEGVGCDGACQRWFHRNCLGMTKAEYQRICADNKIKWHCSRTDCVKSSEQPHNLILKQLTLLTSKITDLSDKVDALISLPAKVDSLVSELEGLNKNISQLENRLCVNESKVNALEKKLDESAQIGSNGNAETIIAEMSDRARRSKNIMLFNFPESQDKNVEVRVKHDNDLVTRLLDSFLPEAGSNSFKTARVGKRVPNKTRPLKVILSKESDVTTFLSGFSSESAGQVDGRLSTVKASRDRTPREMEYYKSLKSELEARISQGERGLSIKYKNNIPSIVSSQKN
jgi:uncharacterized protein YoxC